MADDTHDPGREGRPLTSGEIAIIRDIPLIGHQFDYTQVLIFDNDVSDFGDATTLAGTSVISFDPENYYDDFSADGVPADVIALFAHEITHEWQYQNVDPSLLNARLLEDLKKANGDIDAVYKYSLDDNSKFGDFNAEQQGAIVQDYMRMLQGLPPKDEHIADPDVGAPTFEDLRNTLSFDEPPVDTGLSPDLIDDLLDAPVVEDDRADPLLVDQLLDAPVNDAPPLDAPIADDGPGPNIAPVTEEGPPAPPETPPAGPNVAPVLDELAGEAPAGGDDVTPVTQDGPPPGFDDRSQEEIGAEMEAVLRGENTDQDDDSDADDDVPEDEGDPQADGDGSETPNPVEDPVPGDGEITDLTDRNGDATNPRTDGSDTPAFDGDFSPIVDRHVFAINTGDGSFALEDVDGDIFDLLDRDAPAINTGSGDFEILAVGGELGDLLDRGGTQQTPDESADTELASSTLGDFDFAASFNDLEAFDLA